MISVIKVCTDIWDAIGGFGDDKIYVVQTSHRSHRALHPDDHRPRRPRARPDLRLRHDGLSSPSNGAGAGSRSTRAASPWRSPARGSWARAIPTTCSPTARRASARRPRSRGPRRRSTPTRGDIRQGFVYERVPHITLKSIANNAEIDVIWEKWQATLEPLRAALNAALGKAWEEWEIPREAGARLARRGQERACRMVGGAHRPPEGDRRLDRRQGRGRISLRQALRRQRPHPRRRPVHGRKPVAAPHARGRRNDELIDHGLAEAGAGIRADGPRPEHDFAAMILEISRPPASSRRTRRTGSPSPASPAGRAIHLRRRRVHGGRDGSAAPASSSAPSSAPSPGPTSSPPRARRATPASTC